MWSQKGAICFPAFSPQSAQFHWDTLHTHTTTHMCLEIEEGSGMSLGWLGDWGMPISKSTNVWSPVTVTYRGNRTKARSGQRLTSPSWWDLFHIMESSPTQSTVNHWFIKRSTSMPRKPVQSSHLAGKWFSKWLQTAAQRLWESSHHKPPPSQRGGSSPGPPLCQGNTHIFF